MKNICSGCSENIKGIYFIYHKRMNFTFELCESCYDRYWKISIARNHNLYISLTKERYDKFSVLK